MQKPDYYAYFSSVPFISTHKVDEMGINIILTYFVVSCTVTSPRKSKLMWYGKSFLLTLKIQGLNIVSNTKWKWKWSCSVMSDSLQPMDYSLPGSLVHGIFQARVLEWVAISFSRGSSQPKNRTWVSHVAGRRFTIWATREVSKGDSLQFILLD